MWQSIIHADSCPMRKYKAYKEKKKKFINQSNIMSYAKLNLEKFS